MSSMILFRDSGQTLLILGDFHVSRRMDDFRVSRLHVSRPGKVKFLTQSGQMQN